ncbi:MAG: RNA-binding S4 domain-containing protein [Alphaproteobacteria bacterium]|nr:RNA-binding S4 domain-containing protein [Alphaproteobacteria bacterium]
MQSQRIDKWLWTARIVRTRSLSASVVAAGHVRIDRIKVLKPAHPVQPGHHLTVSLPSRVLVLKVLAIAERRGPASAARLLYQDLSMPGPDGPIREKTDATAGGTC